MANFLPLLIAVTVGIVTATIKEVDGNGDKNVFDGDTTSESEAEPAPEQQGSTSSTLTALESENGQGPEKKSDSVELAPIGAHPTPISFLRNCAIGALFLFATAVRGVDGSLLPQHHQHHKHPRIGLGQVHGVADQTTEFKQYQHRSLPEPLTTVAEKPKDTAPQKLEEQKEQKMAKRLPRRKHMLTDRKN